MKGRLYEVGLEHFESDAKIEWAIRVEVITCKIKVGICGMSLRDKVRAIPQIEQIGELKIENAL